jgi:hypothetical protein
MAQYGSIPSQKKRFILSLQEWNTGVFGTSFDGTRMRAVMCFPIADVGLADVAVFAGLAIVAGVSYFQKLSLNSSCRTTSVRSMPSESVNS